MPREIIIPNIHVILVHYPLGLFITGVIIELTSIFWRQHSVRTAGRWMILLGGLSMIPAALSGVYALHDVATSNSVPSVTWADTVAASSLTVDQWHELVWHVRTTTAATVLVVLAIVSYLAMSDRLRSKLYLLTLGVLLLGAGGMAAGAWFAGEAIYKLGVAVEGLEKSPAGEIGAIQSAAPQTLVEKINTLLPPLQPHVVMAGVAIAVALAAVGLSIRKITCEPPAVEVSDADALVQSLHPPAPVEGIFPSRFWIASSIIFLLTAAGGWYVYGSEAAGTFHPKTMWAMVSDPSQNNGSSFTRDVAHVAAGVALVILPLVMAALARWTPKQKFLLGVFTLVLLVVIGSQLWLGILLMFDGSMGKISRFN